ncbi:hypothetical protein C8R48DRAFT_780985 [Suillus tomentosus]|nr:hypothetical protein C8R48DRAFT_780985 [Suillus tomentosus]
MNCEATPEDSNNLTPTSHPGTSQDGDHYGDIDLDSDSDDIDLDDPTQTPFVMHLDKLIRRSPGFFRFVTEIVRVFRRVHVDIPAEGQVIQFLDDIFAVFEALDDATIETLIAFYACMHTAIPTTWAPEGRRRFIQLNTSESGPKWCVRDVTESPNDDLLMTILKEWASNST